MVVSSKMIFCSCHRITCGYKLVQTAPERIKLGRSVIIVLKKAEIRTASRTMVQADAFVAFGRYPAGMVLKCFNIS